MLLLPMGNLAVISIFGIKNYVRADFNEALLWLTLHEIGHTFGLQHHRNCAMDPLYLHLDYCKKCRERIRGMLYWD